LRWEQGSLNTSIYQGNFAVPTAPLLSVSGTILLTLQNSTLLDNSSNTYQLIASGSASMVIYPQPFYTNIPWSSVTAGDSHTVAVRSDGTLWAWGYNNNGQLGTGNVINRSSPVQVGGLSTWSTRRIVNTGGLSQTVQVDANGAAYMWGYNGNGSLGVGDTVTRSSPVQVSVGNYSSPVQINSGSWTQITAGDYHSAAIRSDGTLWTWGYNNAGQLGQSNTYNNFSPIQVTAFSTSWSQVSAGGSHTIA
jgi:hypothetical protein